MTQQQDPLDLDPGRLIEHFEAEAGCRFNDNGGDNAAMAGIFGALARALNPQSHRAHDDVVAGYLIKHQMSPEGKRERESDAILAEILRSGLGPDDIAALLGGER
jgi:hypothetical protein